MVRRVGDADDRVVLHLARQRDRYRIAQPDAQLLLHVAVNHRLARAGSRASLAEPEAAYRGRPCMAIERGGNPLAVIAQELPIER